jgi:hypothetical protein
MQDESQKGSNLIFKEYYSSRETNIIPAIPLIVMKYLCHVKIGLHEVKRMEFGRYYIYLV